jgi:hypothetical protein
MKKELGISLLVSFVLGALVWALSPALSGHAEPWDAGGVYYPVSLLLAGLLSGLIRPQYFWVHYLGVILGQLAFMLFFGPGGPLIIVGIVLLAVYSLIALAGAAAGAGVRRLLKRT